MELLSYYFFNLYIILTCMTIDRYVGNNFLQPKVAHSDGSLPVLRIRTMTK